MEAREVTPAHWAPEATPLFSVIIPTFNSAGWIEATLESWLQQTEQRFEIIVSDDGSTDDTLRLVESFASRLRVRVIEGGPSGGPSRPRNAGVAVATANLLVMCDSDDPAHPRRLEWLLRASEVARQNPCVYLTNFAEIDEVGEIIDSDGMSMFAAVEQLPRTILSPAVYYSTGSDAFTALLKGDFHRTCSLAYTRSAFDILGGYDESLRNGQDYDAIVRMTANGVPLVWTREVLGYYRKTGGSISTRTVIANTPGRVRVLKRALELASSRTQRDLIHTWLRENLASMAYELSRRGEARSALRIYAQAARYGISWEILKGACGAVLRMLRLRT